MLKDHLLYEPFSDWRFTLARAEGSSLWDGHGNHLIDFTSGWNVTNLGWNHPELRHAAIDQLKKNAYAPMWTSDPAQEAYAKLLVQSLPPGLSTIGRATGGTEANEEAIKIAKAYTGRSKILGFSKTFHGQSQATLAVGFLSPLALQQRSSTTDFVQMEFPTMKPGVVEQTLLEEFSHTFEDILQQENIAAVITEAGIVTGLGSARLAPKGYLGIVRKLTQKYGTLLILDEVGTGFSRTGKLFAMEHEGITPDIITLAKGATNGAAVLGTMITTTNIAQQSFEEALLVSTFGWTPVACAVGLRTLQLHLESRLWERAEIEGQYLLEKLQQELQGIPMVDYINGKGLLVGIHFKESSHGSLVEEIVQRAQQQGLHLVSDHYATLQLMPPLTTSRAMLDEGIRILCTVIKSHSSL